MILRPTRPSFDFQEITSVLFDTNVVNFRSIQTCQFEKATELTKTRHYSGLKELNFIKKVAGQKAAETIGWWQNKCVLKGVMALKGVIYDCGGALTGAYAKEVALTKGYQYLYNIWLM